MRVLVESMESHGVALHQKFQVRVVPPAKTSKKKKSQQEVESAIFDIIDIGLGTWAGSFSEFIRSTAYDPAVGYPIGDVQDNIARDTRLDNDTPFDNTNRNPLSSDTYHDLHCEDEDSGGIGGGGAFYTGDEIEL